MNLEYVEIESIEELGEEETYDITMEDWPSFIANGIVVHNSGMRKLLKELGSGGNLTFEDCVAATALFRPGPIQSGMMDAYVAVKKEFAEPEFAHPAIVDTLTPTMGIVCYQEQTMQMTRDLAGFTFAEADGVRKAIGKKDPVKMAAIGVEFKEKAQQGWLKVELDDGSVKTFHKSELIRCKDGIDRTIEQVIKDDAEF